MRQDAPNYDRESQQADGAEGGAAGFNGRRVASAECAVEAGAALFFLFVSGDQGGGGRENCREGQEEPADSGAEFSGDQAGGDGDHAAEEETDGVLLPGALLQGREIYFYAHEFIGVTSMKRTGRTAAGPDERRSVSCVFFASERAFPS